MRQQISEIDEQFRFEGEADFFPAGDLYLLTHGTLERQRFVPTLAIPPWKRVYGFRTDVRVEAVCDLSAVMAEATAEQFGVSRWFTDHREMLAIARPDVVAILSGSSS